VISATLIFHIYLVASGYPQTNSDESAMGLMARHILYQGKPFLCFMVRIYGLDRGVSGAFFFLLLVLCFALRMGVILDLCFSWLSLFADCLLYSRKIGLLSLLIACLGPSELLFGMWWRLGGLWKCCFSGFAHADCGEIGVELSARDAFA